MKKLNIFAAAVLAVSSLTLTSCEDMFGDFLDRQPSSDLTEKEVTEEYSNMVEFHLDTYNFLRHGAARIDDSWLDAATDLAETSISTSGARTSFNIGNYYDTGGESEFTSSWESYYRGIRKCNRTIDVFTHVIDSIYRPKDESMETYLRTKNTYIAEARFFRVWFYWELFLRFGPVPIIEDVLDPEGDNITGYVERPTVKEFVVDFLLKELEECEPNLYSYQDVVDNYPSHVNQPTARALYARIMLYMASPRYSAESGITWRQSIEATRSFINDYGSNYALMTSETGGVSAYNNAWKLTAYSDENKEVIFYRNDGNIGWDGISVDTPVGEGGSGGNCPSQNLVDMYDMIDGSAPFNGYDATGAPIYTNGAPTVNASSGYSDQTMWENRDPRLASTVLYHGVVWNGRSINVIRGQSDNSISNSNSTPTGYYMRKYIPEEILGAEHTGNAKRLWKILGYAEVLLNLAEAINEVDGPTSEVCSLLDQIRHRAGITGNVSDRMDLTTKDAMRNFIHKERTIELAFEEHRAWDVRRWNVAKEALARNIYGVDVAADGTITRKVAQTRVFEDKMYLYPIPEEEIWKTNIENNPGWN